MRPESGNPGNLFGQRAGIVPERRIQLRSAGRDRGAKTGAVREIRNLRKKVAPAHIVRARAISRSPKGQGCTLGGSFSLLAMLFISRRVHPRKGTSPDATVQKIPRSPEGPTPICCHLDKAPTLFVGVVHRHAAGSTVGGVEGGHATGWLNSHASRSRKGFQ
jgi:hypothetical protein